MRDGLPEFAGTSHAIEFGKLADEVTAAELRKRRAESLREFERLVDLWKKQRAAAKEAFNAALKFGTRAQLDREALEAYEGAHE